MDVTYKREVTVGALVLVGFVVFTGFMFWLTGRSIVSKAPARTSGSAASATCSGLVVLAPPISEGSSAHSQPSWVLPENWLL